jgi:hypothetical protein
MADVSGNANANANVNSNNAPNEIVPQQEKTELSFLTTPIDMRICITGSGMLLGASASMAGALGPKSILKKTPKADIF